MSKTLYDKIFDDHTILQGDDGLTLLHVGRHLAQDGSCHAFECLEDGGRGVRHTDEVYAETDHATPSNTRDVTAIVDPEHRRVVEALERNTRKFNIVHFGL